MTEHVGKLYGKERQVQCHLFRHGVETSTRPLIVTLRSYSTPKAETGPYFITTTGFDACGAVIIQKEVSRVAITPETLPTIEAILDWILVDPVTTSHDPTYRLMNSISYFMSTYCQNTPQLPLVRPYRQLYGTVSELLTFTKAQPRESIT